MHDLAMTIKDLILEYERAINNPSVYDPLGYALYHTWKKHKEMYEKIEGMCAND